jgi:putative transposase
MRRPYPTGRHLRQRGLRAELNEIIDAHLPGMEDAIGTAAACRVLGKSRSTLHRQRNPEPPAESAGRKEFHHPAELAPAEREHVLAVLNAPRFADKSVAQAYTVLLDEGCYLCSQATMHRLLRAAGQSGERRAHATHPAKVKPELVATGPDQVWSWDITKLRGPAKGTWYLLYVIMDIYSRKVIHWEIWPTETGLLAKEFIEHAIEANGGVKPRTVHADRGTSMTSDTVAGLYAKLNIAQSHSRPHVSDDNPFSEAGFKTLKYCPAFPGRFGSIQDANIFCEAFFTYYNTEHRHSGIAMHTPASVHDGSWARIHEHRTATLRAAFEAHPERFRGRCPAPRPLPAKVWINEPPAIIETTPPPQTTQAALCLIQFDRLRPDVSQTFQPYAYTVGDPVSEADPAGQSSTPTGSSDVPTSPGFQFALNYTVAAINQQMNSWTFYWIKNSIGVSVTTGGAIAWFAAEFRTGGPWDLKKGLVGRLPKYRENGENKAGAFGGLYSRIGNYQIFYGVWGNVDYGFVGIAAGLPAWALQGGARINADLGKPGTNNSGNELERQMGIDYYVYSRGNNNSASMEQVIYSEMSGLSGCSLLRFPGNDAGQNCSTASQFG